MSVFVVDQYKQPLMPCSERRARLLLHRRRAVVHHRVPFTIRLKDRAREASQVQAVSLKLDPGSRTTGIALARAEHTQQGGVHHALHLADLAHRGELAPSLLSRLRNILAWAQRYCQWVPISRLDVEWVKFDLALMQNPELTGVQYQRGELFGWEVRVYLLEKFQRRCVYCGRSQTVFELDHVLPSSRGGSDRVSNLVLSCHECNTAKGNQTASEFGHPQVEVQARQPLRDAAAMNATRYALVDTLKGLGLPIGTWSGGRTKWNRVRFGIGKAHCLDALCVGNLASAPLPVLRTLVITAHGRGSYQRTNS
jgi:hypothetical protein